MVHGQCFQIHMGLVFSVRDIFMFISSGSYVVGKFIFFKFIIVVCCLQHFVHVLTFAML